MKNYMEHGEYKNLDNTGISVFFGGMLPTRVGARLNGIQEVRGSIPLVSIIKALEDNDSGVFSFSAGFVSGVSSKRMRV